MTVGDTYYSRAQPILRFLAARDQMFDHVTIDEIATATGLESAHVTSELGRLTFDGFLQGELRQYMGQIGNGRLVGTALTEKGARAVGMWPSENLYAAIIELIDRQIEQTPTRTRAQSSRTSRTQCPPLAPARREPCSLSSFNPRLTTFTETTHLVVIGVQPACNRTCR